MPSLSLWTSLTFLCLGLSTSLAGSSTSPLLLKSYDGFAWGSSSNSITVEMFGDFLCPDTQAAWNDIWKPLLDRFGRQVQFRYHMLPLPFHRASFDSSQAALAYIYSLPHVNLTTNFFTFVDTIFQQQDQFSNTKTEDLSHRQVIGLFAKMVDGIGLSAEEFAAAFANSKFDYAARASWKWGVAKGVYGTPTYAINGALIDEAAEYDLKKWTDVLRAMV